MDLHKILLISLGHLSCDLNGGALPSLMPYLAAAHGFNYQAAGALMFAYSATSSLVQPVFGYLADKYARSWFVPLAVLLAGGSLGLVGFLDSYWAIFLTLMLCGVGGALFHPEGARYANLVSGDRKGAGMSIFSVGGNSGFVVGPLLVAGATSVAGLHGTAVFLLLALCTASFLFFQMRGWQRQIPQSRAAAGQAEPRNDWHAFGVLTLVIASRSILFLGFNTYIPMYWHDVFGQSKEFGAMMLAFFCVCGVSSNVLGGFLADRIGPARGPGLRLGGQHVAGGPAAGPAGRGPVRTLQLHGGAGPEAAGPQHGLRLGRDPGPAHDPGRHGHAPAGLDRG